VRVLIVDDHVLFAEAVQLALRDQGVADVEVVHDGASAIDVMHDAGRRTDVVLMDIGLPDRSGLAVGGEMLQRWPDVRIIALTALNDRSVLAEAMRVGFHGYLTKDAQVARVVNAIRTVEGGEVVLPRSMSTTLRSRTDGTDDDAELLAGQLTGRELEVLSLLSEGCASTDIAERMTISKNTVRTHVQSILAKLGVHSRLEAAAFAVRHGVVRSGAERSQV
jgi:two-component system nitrate/nitrite response regulator NarL